VADNKLNVSESSNCIALFKYVLHVYLPAVRLQEGCTTVKTCALERDIASRLRAEVNEKMRNSNEAANLNCWLCAVGPR
jgi:hypothetical protein